MIKIYHAYDRIFPARGADQAIAQVLKECPLAEPKKEGQATRGGICANWLAGPANPLNGHGLGGSWGIFPTYSQKPMRT